MKAIAPKKIGSANIKTCLVPTRALLWPLQAQLKCWFDLKFEPNNPCIDVKSSPQILRLFTKMEIGKDWDNNTRFISLKKVIYLLH